MSCCEKLKEAIEDIVEILEAQGQNGFEVLQVLADGQTVFNLSETPSILAMIPVFDIEGLVHLYGIDYTILGNTLTWGGSYPLATTDNITITYKFI